MTPAPKTSRWGAVAGAVLAVLLLAPALGPGFVLVRDMVFVPEQPLTRSLLGLDGVPRAVPSDLVVALASRLVPAAWLQDVILVAVVVGGAWGAARLAPTTSRAGALAAATAYGWSAYLHERLLLGHWALLVGWAVLPWAARAALAWRAGGSGWPAVLCLAVGALGGASAGLLVGLVVVVCGRPVRAAAATAVLALPWAVPALLLPGGVPAGDPAGVAAFASRADTPFGVLGSLLTGGGVWARAAVPPGRAAGSVAALLVLGLAVAGLPRLVQRRGRALPVVGGVALGIALLGAMPGTADLLRLGVEQLPAVGLLRDGQKWVAPLVLLVAAAAGCGTEAVAERLTGTRTRRLAAALAVLAPLAALPGAAWGEGGRLQRTEYPEDWAAVTARVSADRVAVLPWGLYRAFPWNGDRTVLDPAPRWLSARAVVDDDLPLSTGSVRGEDPLAEELDAAASSGGPLRATLAAAGIGQVLVERTDRGADAEQLRRQVSGLRLVVATPELALYDVPGALRPSTDRAAWPAVLAHATALGLALAALVGTVRTVRTVRTPVAGAHPRRRSRDQRPES